MDWGADTDLVRDELDELFTDREDQQDLVRTLANAPEGESVLVQVFVGVSGAGKTHLRKRLKRLLQSNDVPTVERDFDQRREAIDPAVLVTQLISAGRFEAPRTFLALLRLAMKESESDVKALSQELASDALGAAADFFMSGLETLGTAGFLKSLGNFWHKRYKASKDPINRYLATEEGKRDQIRVASLEESDLRDSLYDRLAQDIAANPIRPGKAVQLALLVDSYDFAFQAQSTPDDRRRSLEWISDLSNAFVRRGSAERILVLCFGQTAGVVPGQDGSVVEHRLGGFERVDAEEYWRKRKLPEVHFEAALEASREEGGEERYHVFSLGLAGDMVTTNPDALVEKESRRGTDPPTALTERFLRLLLGDDQMNLKQLALAQWWDDEAAAWVFGVAGNYNQTQVKLAWLKRFSFVQEVSEGRFTLHSVMRRVLSETSNLQDVSHWQQEWINHWTSRSATETDDFAAQAWRHRFALDIGSAIGDWEEKTAAALSEMRSADHLWYLNVAEPLVFDLSANSKQVLLERTLALLAWSTSAQQALVGNLRHLLHRSVAGYRLGLGVFTSESWPEVWAKTQDNLGNALQILGKQGDALALQEAISAYRLALEVYTRDSSPAYWATTQNNLGDALMIRAGMNSDPESAKEALAAYGLAEEGCLLAGMTQYGPLFAEKKRIVRELLGEK